MDFGAPVSRFLSDEETTLRLGAGWARALATPLTVHLQGSLRVDKATFIRGLLRGLKYTGAVKSPTYTIAESYVLPQFVLHHFDLYRFTSPEGWEDAGLDELFASDCVYLIEQPQQSGEFTPPTDVTISLNHTDGGRAYILAAHTANGRKSLEVWLN